MNQNPEQLQPPPEKSSLEKERRRKHSRRVFEMGGTEPLRVLKTYKNLFNWKEKRAKQIQFESIRSEEKEPVFSIALHCGTKNGKNEVLHEYIHPQQSKSDLQARTINSFQKILNLHKHPRMSEDPKRLTFVNFKTKRSQKDNFFSSSEIKFFKVTSQSSRKRAQTEPRAFTTSFRRTGFPKQLKDLKQQIKELPVVRQSKQSKNLTAPAYPEEYNVSNLIQSKYNPSMVQSKLQSPYDQSEENSYQPKFFRESKCSKIKDYIEQLNEVITYADEVMQQEVQPDTHLQPSFPDADNTHQKTRETKKPKLAIYRKYWPEYRHCSLKVRTEEQCQQVANFFSNFSYSDSELNEQLQSLVNIIKVDLNRQQLQMNREIAESEKKSFEQRFQYKLNFQRENYKRNVKSYLKCKKEYRIEKRREEVRANGITRIKKSNKTEKNIQPQPKEEEED